MRTHARSRDYQQQQINFFCLDQDICTAVMDYFDIDPKNFSHVALDCLVPPPKRLGRPNGTTRLTPAQKKENRRLLNQKKYLERKEKKKQNK
jgi:hypothetical protein